MASWLIDDRGLCWDNDSPEFARRLMSSLTGERLATYAVNNLGFIAIREVGGSTHIQVRPAVVKPVALAACLYWIGDRQKRLGRIAISFHEHQWRHCIYGSFHSAVRALAHCVKTGQEDRSRLNSRRSLRPGAEPLPGPIDALLRYWSQAGGWHEAEQFENLLHSVLQDRYFLLAASGDEQQLYIEKIGSNYRMFDEGWRARAQGSRFEDMPDFSYGTWVAEAYRQALMTGEPQLDRIDAILDVVGAGLSRVHYTRIIVPFRTHDNRRLVLSTSAVHDLVEHIDRPFEHVGKV
jgi:hypothetical protein